MTHPMPNTSSTGSSGCSQVDRFGKHFENCRNREGHVKAFVFFPTKMLSKITVALSEIFEAIATHTDAALKRNANDRNVLLFYQNHRQSLREC